MADPKSQPALTVYRGFPGSACYIWSPFVTKLEARLRFAGLSYKTEQGSARQAPRGKIPYIVVTQDEVEKPQLLADSQLISEKLSDEGILPDLNAKLSPAENALDMAVMALMEDKLYFYNTYERWNENYYTMRDKILAAIPYPIRVVVGALVWRKVNTSLYGQGTGRFSSEEIHSFRTKIWHNTENLLADAKRKSSKDQGVFWVFGGKEPTEADTVLFGFIIGGLVCDAGPVSARLIRSLPSVIEYARKIHEQYFPDYDSPVWE